MSYYQVPSKRLPGSSSKHKSQLRIFTPPNLMYFFMNTHVPPFDDLEVRRAVNYAISRSWLVRLAGGLAARPRTSCRRATRRTGRTASTGTTCARRTGSCTSRASAGSGSSSGTTTSPTDLPFTEYLVTVLNQLGFRASEKVVTAGSYWTTLGDGKTQAQIGFADWVQDYPHPLDWFAAPRRPARSRRRTTRTTRTSTSAG